MKEILRIMHARKQINQHAVLNDYNLEIYEGELLYIYGSSDSGIHELLTVLSGKETLDEGTVYLQENRILPKNLEKHGIYVASVGQNLVEGITVSENLYVVRVNRIPWRYYDKKKTEKKARILLKEAGMEIPAEALVYQLSGDDRQKLSILKAAIQGKKLIILDFTKVTLSGEKEDEIIRLIEYLKKNGMACIVINEKLSKLSDFANRIQLVKHGTDLMEWGSLPVQEKIRPDYEQPGERLFEGIWNPNLEDAQAFWIRRQASAERTIYIPMNSAQFLLENLSISQNISLTIPERIGKTPVGYIAKYMEDNIALEYYVLTGINREKKLISELSFLERKILSVYRWEVSRPDTILLDNPYWGMDMQETDTFREYLRHLKEKGIRVILISESIKELNKDCYKIFRMDTKVQK